MSKRRRLSPVGTPGFVRRQPPPITDKDFIFDYELNLIYSLTEDALDRRLKHLDALGDIGNARGVLLSLIRDGDDRERKRLGSVLSEHDFKVDKVWPKLETDSSKVNYLLKLLRLPVSSDPPQKLPSRQGTDFDRLAGEYDSERGDLQRRFISRLLPLLKEEIRSRPHETYQEKLDLVRWINSELRRFDLSIQSPLTGRAAILSADSTNRQGRFKIKGEDEHHNMTNVNITNISEFIDKLSLVDSPARSEPAREWREKIQRNPESAKRA